MLDSSAVKFTEDAELSRFRRFAAVLAEQQVQKSPPISFDSASGRGSTSTTNQGYLRTQLVTGTSMILAKTTE
jgi:hypothetical protein